MRDSPWRRRRQKVPDTDLRAAARDLRELIESEADQVEKSLGMTPPIVDALV